jgi:hypothetical protein
MSKQPICNNDSFYELSSLFASKTGACGYKESKFDCKNCPFTWDCLSAEIARQVIAMGYVKNNHRISEAITIEEIAKEIARARGYGCDSTDSCSKCTCASVLDCIPLQLANCMAEKGYRKKEVENA